MKSLISALMSMNVQMSICLMSQFRWKGENTPRASANCYKNNFAPYSLAPNCLFISSTPILTESMCAFLHRVINYSFICAVTPCCPGIYTVVPKYVLSVVWPGHRWSCFFMPASVWCQFPKLFAMNGLSASLVPKCFQSNKSQNLITRSNAVLSFPISKPSWCKWIVECFSSKTPTKKNKVK